jgi:D-alanine transaminase
MVQVMADPLPTCYLNGEYLPLAEARISPLDRGFLYGDGAYEVMPVYGGRPFRLEAHCARLTRSLGEIRMPDPHSRTQWCQIFASLIERNGGGDQYIYWQVTRGAERGRNHAPLPDIPRTVFAFCAPLPAAPPAVLETGAACVTAEDTRWGRCDIKSVALLANVLLRQLAVDAGAAETILLRNGELTEASASTVHVVLGGELRTPPNSRRILPGTTRSVIEELAARAGVPYRAAAVSESELRAADEIWISAATREVQPVTTLDGKSVGTGRPGPLWRRVYDEFQRWKQELQHQPWR